MADLPKTTVVRLTYVGKRLTTSQKIAYVWQEGDGTLRTYAKQLASTAVGGIWDFHQNDQGQVFRSGTDVEPQYLGLHTNAEERLGWELEHHAADTQARQYRQAKTDMGHSELVQLLGPVIRQYGRTNAAGRRALLATVIEIITSGRSLRD